MEFGHHAGFKLGLNMFADWDRSELTGDKGKRMFRALGKREPSRGRNLNAGSPATTAVLRTDDMAESLDWRQMKVVREPPLFQGDCGSCWAITAAGALES